jgi:peptide-methionine (R)-S-oxide reductase
MHLDRRAFLGLTGVAAASSLVLFGRSGGAAPTVHFPVNHTPAEWRRILGPQRYSILRDAATEHPFTSPLLNEHRRGTFVCAACANRLFSSTTKFDSDTGWPSFWQVLPGGVVTQADHSLLMERTEVLCAHCGGHLGHVFDDGPRPTGLRYCMNGLALNFRVA